MRVRHVRIGKEVKIPEAITFLAADRQHADSAYAGDIIGIHNHGTINIGDSFTQGEEIRFTGIPSFAPEIFRRAVLKDPLRLKALQKGLAQLCEEGAAQLFRPTQGSGYIVGALGMLQFEVIAARLREEYRVEATFEPTPLKICRWLLYDEDNPTLQVEFENRLRRLRCRPADPPVGTLDLTPLPETGELSGRFDIELPRLEDAATGEPIHWSPHPLVLHGSFDRLQSRNENW